MGRRGQKGSVLPPGFVPRPVGTGAPLPAATGLVKVEDAKLPGQAVHSVVWQLSLSTQSDFFGATVIYGKPGSVLSCMAQQGKQF